MTDKQMIIDSGQKWLDAFDSEVLYVSRETVKSVLKVLKEEPQIVRCKDCKHRPELKLYSDRNGNYTAVEFPDGSKCPCQCEDFFYSWYPKDDWFCADGERKEGR